MPNSIKSGLVLAERMIPVPSTVSPEAQAFLSRGLSVMPPEIPHSDKQAYKIYIAQIEEFLIKAAKSRAESYPADIADHHLSKSTLYEITPRALRTDFENNAILHIHGGAFIVGGGISCAYTAQPVASLTGIRTFSIDYRMPPDHPFPRGLEDCVEAYKFLLQRYTPTNIGFEGSSAGANLVAATILKARDEGLPLPGACSLHTAGVDLTAAGDSFTTNEHIDVVLRKNQRETMLLYADGHSLTHPYVSPLFGDFFKGFPPSLLLTGTRDLLLSPTVMMHRALRRAGIDADLHVFEAMPHGGLGGSSPEDYELRGEIARFFLNRLALFR
jgi:monoterpene epsilon-lactone hydrolase